LMAAIIIIIINWILLKYIDCNIVLILDIALGISSNLFIYRKIRKMRSSGELKIKDEVQGKKLQSSMKEAH